MYTFAEPKLSDFANRIKDDLPHYNVITTVDLQTEERDNLNKFKKKSEISTNSLFEWDNFTDAAPHQSIGDNPPSTANITSIEQPTIEMLGMFREQIIATFADHF